MHPKEQEIRQLVQAAPFVPFRLVTSSGERYKVPTRDHIFFPPNTDEDGIPIPESERAQSVCVFSRGVRHRFLFFDAITAIDVGTPEVAH
jgi:hypothetical protein